VLNLATNPSIGCHPTRLRPTSTANFSVSLRWHHHVPHFFIGWAERLEINNRERAQIQPQTNPTSLRPASMVNLSVSWRGHDHVPQFFRPLNVGFILKPLVTFSLGGEAMLEISRMRVGKFRVHVSHGVL